MIFLIIMIMILVSLFTARYRFFGWYSPMYHRPFGFRRMMRGPRPMCGPHMMHRPMGPGPRRF